MNEDLTRPDLVGEVRLRLPLPFVIPVGSLLLIGLVTVGMSRVLLNVPPEIAVVIATAVALNILGGFAVLATRPRITSSNLAELFIVVTYPILIGIVIAAMGLGEGEAEAGAREAGGRTEPTQGAPAGGPAATATLTIVAAGTAFDTSTATVVANEEVTVTLENEDSVAHNFSVYEGEGAAGEPLAIGDAADPGATVESKVPPQRPGTYFFRCDLHPTAMTGDYVVE